MRLSLCHTLCVQSIEVDRLQKEFGKAALGNNIGDGFAGVREQYVRTIAANNRLEFSFIIARDVEQARLL